MQERGEEEEGWIARALFEGKLPAYSPYYGWIRLDPTKFIHTGFGFKIVTSKLREQGKKAGSRQPGRNGSFVLKKESIMYCLHS